MRDACHLARRGLSNDPADRDTHRVRIWTRLPFYALSIFQEGLRAFDGRCAAIFLFASLFSLLLSELAFASLAGCLASCLTLQILDHVPSMLPGLRILETRQMRCSENQLNDDESKSTNIYRSTLSKIWSVNSSTYPYGFLYEKSWTGCSIM